jgi:molecular chaperone DnaJ
LDHTLSVTIAAGTQPGTMVRLRGRGIKDRSGQTGDMLLRIQTRTPKDLPEDLVQQLHDHGKK